jgi:hypothetical protein
MTDADKLASVNEFLRTDGARCAEFALDRYEKSGRGLVFAAFRAGTAQTQCHWITAAEFPDHVAAGEFPPFAADEVAQKVAAYDPRRQFVFFVSHFDDSVTTYVVRSGPIGIG